MLQPINASSLEVEKFRKCLEKTLESVCFPEQLRHPQVLGAVYERGSLNVLIDVDEKMMYSPRRPTFTRNKPALYLYSQGP